MIVEWLGANVVVMLLPHCDAIFLQIHLIFVTLLMFLELIKSFSAVQKKKKMITP